MFRFLFKLNMSFEEQKMVELLQLVIKKNLRNLKNDLLYVRNMWANTL